MTRFPHKSLSLLSRINQRNPMWMCMMHPQSQPVPSIPEHKGKCSSWWWQMRSNRCLMGDSGKSAFHYYLPCPKKTSCSYGVHHLCRGSKCTRLEPWQMRPNHCQYSSSQVHPWYILSHIQDLRPRWSQSLTCNPNLWTGLLLRSHLSYRMSTSWWWSFCRCVRSDWMTQRQHHWLHCLASSHHWCYCCRNGIQQTSRTSTMKPCHSNRSLPTRE